MQADPDSKGQCQLNTHVWEQNSPEWEGACQPLLEYLSEPRTWRDLRHWAGQNSPTITWITQALAWLETAGKAGTFVLDVEGVSKDRNTCLTGHFRWVHSGWLLRGSQAFSHGEDQGIAWMREKKTLAGVEAQSVD